MIPRAPLVRLVRKVYDEQCEKQRQLGRRLRFTPECVSALQCAVEHFLASLFESASIAARHAQRVTVDDRDMRVVHEILESQGMQNFFKEMNALQAQKIEEGHYKGKVKLVPEPPPQAPLLEGLWDKIQDQPNARAVPQVREIQDALEAERWQNAEAKAKLQQKRKKRQEEQKRQRAESIEQQKKKGLTKGVKKP